MRKRTLRDWIVILRETALLCFVQDSSEWNLRAKAGSDRADFARQAVYDESKANFRTIVADIPSFLPQPDGTTRVSNAANANSAALETYTKALREFNDFILKGVIPDRLV